MWIDHLTTDFWGDSGVKVERKITSPATPDELTISFPDGSTLFVKADVSTPPEAESEIEAAELAGQTTAVKFYTWLVERLYTSASVKELDTDDFE